MDRLPDALTPGEGLRIGDLSEATGLGIETLRAWERRYGRPLAVRRPSGHRRYDPVLVPWLRRVAEALVRGHRPSEVVPLSDADLEALLEADRPGAPDAGVAAWLDQVGRSDAVGLARTLRAAWRADPTVAFLDGRLAPFLTAIGRRWAEGTLEIRHEHLATEVLGDLLRRWREARISRVPGRRARAPTLLLATFPGERHALGLQLAALVAAMAGARPTLLGLEAPVAEIVRAASETRARAVAVAVSLATAGPASDRLARELRAALPRNVSVWLGGEGARGPGRAPPGVERAATLADLHRWVLDLVGGERPGGAAGPRAPRR